MKSGATKTETVYRSTMAGFLKICIVPAIMEVALVLYAVKAAISIPAVGDLTLRYVTIGVPGFWAVAIPLFMLIVFFLHNGAEVVLTPKAFIYRRGRFSVMIPWQEMSVQQSVGRKFDKQFSVTGKDSRVVIRSLFFPDYLTIEEDITSRLKRRSSYEISI